MSERQDPSGPQFRADRPEEQEAVRTTIVGGRPPGSGQSVGDIPRGIEVLVKKASVDAEFKKLLLATRAEAAGEIGLALDPAEAMMLAAVPATQLESIIARTRVPDPQRWAFLGKAAAAMLAALGLTTPGCGKVETKGNRPDEPKKRERFEGTKGAEPDLPPDVEPPAKPKTERPEQIPAPTGSRPDLPPPEPGQPAE